MKAREWIAKGTHANGLVLYAPGKDDLCLDVESMKDPRNTKVVPRDRTRLVVDALRYMHPTVRTEIVDRDAEIAAYIKANPEQ